MSNIDKKIIERNDLALLHLVFDEDSLIEREELVYPMVQSQKHNDLWSKVIDAIINNRADEYPKLYAEIDMSSLSTVGREWCKVMLVVAMGLSFEGSLEIRNYQLNLQDKISDDVLLYASKRIMDNMTRIIQQERWRVRELEEQKLKKLKKIAADKNNEVNEANANLMRHRGRQ